VSRRVDSHRGTEEKTGTIQTRCGKSGGWEIWLIDERVFETRECSRVARVLDERTFVVRTFVNVPEHTFCLFSNNLHSIFFWHVVTTSDATIDSHETPLTGFVRTPHELEHRKSNQFLRYGQGIKKER
jgi:hypothetical protein